ncbi:MAG: hypothetical protein WCF24_13230 [Acidimicrobiales bacterium]
MEPHEIDNLRRSVVIVTPGQPCGLDRETVLQVLAKLQPVTRGRDLLAAELRHPSEGNRAWQGFEALTLTFEPAPL